MDVVVDFCSNNSQSCLDETIKRLNTLAISNGKSDKENSIDKDTIASVQKCLKTAHKRLLQESKDIQSKLIQLCRRCLRILESGKPSFHALAYATIKHFMSLKAHHIAYEEAILLHQSLMKKYKSIYAANYSETIDKNNTATSSSLSTDGINIIVGTVLSLALCWCESPIPSPENTSSLMYTLNAFKDVHLWQRYCTALRGYLDVFCTQLCIHHQPTTQITFSTHTIIMQFIETRRIHQTLSDTLQMHLPWRCQTHRVEAVVSPAPYLHPAPSNRHPINRSDTFINTANARSISAGSCQNLAPRTRKARLYAVDGRLRAKERQSARPG